MNGTRRRPGARRAAVVLILAVALVGCGGGDAGDPLAGGPEEEDVRLEPGDRPVRFRLDTAVTEETRAFIIETLAWAHADLGDSGPLTVHLYSDEDHFVGAYTNEFAISTQEARQRLADGELAFASPGGHIWVYLPNFHDNPATAFRPRRPATDQRATVFHEYFHTVQDWLAELRFQSVDEREQSFVPRWLVEGCAEYFSTSAAAARGLVDQAQVRQAMIELTHASGESLRSLEAAGGATFIGGSGGAYFVGYLGCERLATTRGRDNARHRFWASLATQRDWKRAFVEAFGVEPGAFYDDFEAWRLTLP